MNKQALFSWVQERYGTLPDYPWNDPNAVLRHYPSRKWYAAVLVVRRQTLGLSGEGTVDVVNVKCDPMLSGSLRLQKGFFPAYHMNKEKWLTILLDGSVDEETVKTLVDMSYQLTK